MSTPFDVAALESAVLQAGVDRQWDLLADLLDDDFQITTAGWLAAPAGKDEWLREVADKHLLHGFSIDWLQERAIDNVRVAWVLSTQTVTWKGERQDFRFRYTDIWRPFEGRWRLAVRHASMVPPAGPETSG